MSYSTELSTFVEVHTALVNVGFSITLYPKAANCSPYKSNLVGTTTLSNRVLFNLIQTKGVYTAQGRGHRTVR